ncbi:peptide chain release factor N(5)-glutamine methyltransferase [Tengunoibacter tsumagoiensis]|uniref:Release factor glutamine methyltransferase n=1 Tax=Tengunoibacter tsumagoiensis TaxID=2014871 RepID=A0A402A4D6_9CHLR|nr:peptide chain release factor N(5)-glutamine methyltransferase [Tengunoibacter tsumagoiensis]GCE13916.1 release factor glutamine methyltransferase [Tengunoibacter tsumagoiensis]
MTTIREALEQGKALLTAMEPRNARLESQILLEHVLGVERSILYAYPERQLEQAQWKQYQALLERRQQKEPIAYLLESQEFYSLDFFVDRRVLIPRPETEILVESALQAIRQRLSSGVVPLVADIGTGSGAIPITLAVEEPRLSLLYACDISPDALAVARVNAQRHHVLERVCFLQGDLIAPLPEPVDILCANLPYVGTAEIPDLESDVYDYEPHLALFSGPDGLGLIQKMCKEIKEFGTLREGGEIFLEIGYRQGDVLTHLLQEIWPAARITCRQDYAGWDRLMHVAI